MPNVNKEPHSAPGRISRTEFERERVQDLSDLACFAAFEYGVECTVELPKLLEYEDELVRL